MCGYNWSVEPNPHWRYLSIWWLHCWRVYLTGAAHLTWVSPNALRATSGQVLPRQSILLLLLLFHCQAKVTTWLFAELGNNGAWLPIWHFRTTLSGSRWGNKWTSVAYKSPMLCIGIFRFQVVRFQGVNMLSNKLLPVGVGDDSNSCFTFVDRQVRVLSLSFDASLRSFSSIFAIAVPIKRETARTEIGINTTINKVRRLFTLIYLTFLSFPFIFFRFLFLVSFLYRRRGGAWPLIVVLYIVPRASW